MRLPQSDKSGKLYPRDDNKGCRVPLPHFIEDDYCEQAAFIAEYLFLADFSRNCADFCEKLLKWALDAPMANLVQIE
jgi:hypothetical protein